jgi:hypothetical protein
MKTIELPPSFYLDLGENNYQPTEATIGPWSATFQHGGPPIALIAHALRTYPTEHGLRIARITAEILGPVPVAPCAIKVRVIRSGKRIELLQAEMSSGGKPVLIAHAWRLEESTNCVNRVADPFSPPDLPAAQEQRFFPGIDYFPYAQALEWRFTEGSFTEPGPATVWTRPRIPLLENTPNDSLESLLLMLDSANGISAELDIRSWNFVPVDLTLNIHRLPQGLWLGMAAQTMIEPQGIGTVTTAVFDRAGAVGRSLHTLFVRPK